MTIEELINSLSEYPHDLELSEIKAPLVIYRRLDINRINSAYVADLRIAGSEPWGCLQRMERQTNLAAIAKSMLHGLKFNIL